MSDSVLIGVIEDSLIDSSVQLSYTDNRIGGVPLFSPLLDLSGLNLACESCTVDRSFILQIYCPVDDSPLDRILYLFVCTNPACKNRNISCFRAVSPPVKTPSQDSQKPQQDKLFDDQWTNDEDDWGVEAENSQHEEEKEEILVEKLSNLDIKSNSAQNNFQKIFDQRFISVFDEPEKKKKPVKDEQMKDLSEFVTDSELKDQTCTGEEYEKDYSNAFNNNQTNYNFYKRISRFPSQIIRYDWSGEPLKFNDYCFSKILNKCQSCGSARTFELQLMPALVSVLSQLRTDPNFSLDFGTVLVYSCSNNCFDNTSGLYTEQTFSFAEDYNQEQWEQLENS